MKRLFFVAMMFSILWFPAHAETPANSATSQRLIEIFKEAEIKRKPEYARQFQEAKPLAEKGDDNAQYKLGQAYLWGHGTTRDVAAAERWLIKSAEQGNAKAQLSLGMLYNGNIAQKIIETDKERAESWLQKSAKQGNAESYVYLAQIYQIKDKVEAFKWVCLAMRSFRAKDTRNHPREMMNIDFFMHLFEGLTPEQVAEALKRVNAWQPDQKKR